MASKFCKKKHLQKSFDTNEALEQVLQNDSNDIYEEEDYESDDEDYHQELIDTRSTKLAFDHTDIDDDEISFDMTDTTSGDDYGKKKTKRQCLESTNEDEEDEEDSVSEEEMDQSSSECGRREEKGGQDLKEDDDYEEEEEARGVSVGRRGRGDDEVDNGNDSRTKKKPKYDHLTARMKRPKKRKAISSLKTALDEKVMTTFSLQREKE